MCTFKHRLEVSGSSVTLPLVEKEIILSPPNHHAQNHKKVPTPFLSRVTDDPALANAVFDTFRWIDS